MTAKNNNKPWTHAEMAKVQRLRAQGLTYTQIGEKIGRAKGSILNALHRKRNGKFRVGRQAIKRPWTEQETNEAVQMRLAGMFPTAIARKLGRTEAAVRNRLVGRIPGGQSKLTFTQRLAAAKATPKPPKKRWCYILGDAKVPVEHSCHLPAGGRFAMEVPT